MEFRNPQFNVDGTIDCEVNHPVYGWIPFTASATDVEPLGAAVFAAAQGTAAAYVAPPAPTAEELLEIERAGMVCSRFQARAALMLAEPELLTAVTAAVSQAEPFVQLAWAEAVEFKRNSATIVALAVVLELTPTQVDDLFRAAMQIHA